MPPISVLKTRSYQAKAATPEDAENCKRCTILIFDEVPEGWEAKYHQNNEGYCTQCILEEEESRK
jgi:hypothetical protein